MSPGLFTVSKVITSLPFSLGQQEQPTPYPAASFHTQHGPLHDPNHPSVCECGCAELLLHPLFVFLSVSRAGISSVVCHLSTVKCFFRQSVVFYSVTTFFTTFISVAGIKYPDKRASWGTKGLFGSQFQVTDFQD